MRERKREKEAVGQINSWVFFLHSNDEIWCKQIWCIIIAVLHCFFFFFFSFLFCFDVSAQLVLVLFCLRVCVCAFNVPALHKCFDCLFHNLPENQKVYENETNLISACQRDFFILFFLNGKKLKFSLSCWSRFRSWIDCVVHFSDRWSDIVVFE